MGAQHRGRRGARQARRDDREYREYLREEQRRQPGCIVGRMPAPFMRWVLAQYSTPPRDHRGHAAAQQDQREGFGNGLRRCDDTHLIDRLARRKGEADRTAIR